MQLSAESEMAFLVIISLLPGRPLVSHPCQNFSFRSVLFVRKICQGVCPTLRSRNPLFFGEIIASWLWHTLWPTLRLIYA